MEHRCDVAIVGGGLASLAAAAQLTQKGLEVALVRKAPGATSLSSGAWDICDDPYRSPSMEVDRWNSIHQNIQRTLECRPHHPFQYFRKRFDGEALFSWMQFQIKQVLRCLSLNLDGDGSHPIAALTQLGTVKATGLVQSSMAAADLRKMKGARLLVVGLEGLPGFNSSFIADALEAFQQGQENNYIDWVGQVDIPLKNLKSQSSLSPFEIAGHLDQEENFVELSHELQNHLKQPAYTHLLFPPVLGLRHTPKIVEALERLTGKRVSETLAFVPSVPGWRLNEGIMSFFKREGFDCFSGEAVGYESEGRIVGSLWVHQGDQRLRLKARSFILASGKFIGGGVVGRNQIREPLFGLPLFADGSPIKDLSWARLTRSQMSERQPFRTIGIQVNESSQPIDPEGQICFDNLYAAGEILSGYDPGVESCTAGVAILSGAVAGMEAA